MSQYLSSSTAAIIRTSVDARWKNIGLATPVWWEGVVDKTTMSTQRVVKAWPVMPPELKRWESGQPAPMSTVGSFDVTITSDRYGLAIPMDLRQARKFEKLPSEWGFEDFYKQSDALAVVCKTFPQRRIAAALQGGKTKVTTFDGAGKYFFATDHPSRPIVGHSSTASANQSNLFATTNLTHSNVKTVWAVIASYVGESGLALGIRPNVVLVPPQLEWDARQIFESTTVATASNAGETSVGAVENVFAGTCKVIVCPELANEPKVWYPMCTNRGVPGITYGEYEAPMIKTTALDGDRAVTYDEIHYVGSVEGEASLVHPYMIARCEGS